MKGLMDNLKNNVFASKQCGVVVGELLVGLVVLAATSAGVMALMHMIG